MSQIEQKLDNMKRQIQKNDQNGANRQNSFSNSRIQSQDKSYNQQQINGGGQNKKNYALDEMDTDVGRNVKRMQSEAAFGSQDDGNKQLRLKKNPNFGGQPQPAQNYVSSDDDIPVGFSRRKRLSSTSSFNKKFESGIVNNAPAPNIVNLSRREDQVRSQRGDPQYQEQQNIDELNLQIKQAREQEEERIHQETEAMLEQKREQIQQRLRDHEQNIRKEKEQLRDRDQQQYEDRQNSGGKKHHHKHHEDRKRREYQNQPGIAPPPYQQYPFMPYDLIQKNYPLMYPGQQNMQPFQHPLQSQQFQMPYSLQQQPMLGTIPGPQGTNFFPPTGMPNLPQYTNLDIPAHLDQNLKTLKETLQKLKGDNMNLKQELNKKQLLSIDLENNAVSNFDKDKYQQHAQNNLKLKQQVEDLKRKEIELKSRLSSLQANKQYLHGRTNTLSMDIDVQDKQEDSLNKQIVEFNGLIREKESYIKQLMNELNSLKESKEQYHSELQVLNHKEEFMVNELIFKEDQLNEIMMTNEEMRRKIQSGQSQSKYLISDNERLKKELGQFKEEVAVLKASSDFLNNEHLGLNEHLHEYEHKLTLSQNTIEQLQRQNQQDKSELSHYNQTIQTQQKAYEELKNQLQLINERNSRISLQNEMMMLRQQQQQEQLMMQMTQQQQSMRLQREREEMAHSTKSSVMGKQDQSHIEEHSFQEQPMNNSRIQNQNLEDSLHVQSFDRRPSAKTERIDQQRKEMSPQQEDVQHRNKRGDSMANTLSWDEQPNQITPQRRSTYTDRANNNTQQQQDPNRSPEQVQQMRNQGRQMAGLLSHDNDADQKFGNRHSMPVNSIRPRFQDREVNEIKNGGRDERSRSLKREDKMNDILKWSLDDKEPGTQGSAAREQPRINQDDYQREITQNHRDLRSISGDRKNREGKQIVGVFQWDTQDNPNVQNTRQSNPNTSRQVKVEQVDLMNSSPTDLRREIRDKHHGGNMANLLAFERPEQSQLTQSPQKSNNQYGNITINLNQSSAQRRQQAVGQEQNERKGMSLANSTTNSTTKLGQGNTRQKVVGIDLSMVDSRPVTTVNLMMSPSNNAQAQLNPKNYGTINEQIHMQQQSRKENLDNLLLQLQIEKDKMAQELQKIGDFPKNTQQIRRKNELNNELNIVNSNITNIKNKIKVLKQ
eukprot:403376153